MNRECPASDLQHDRAVMPADVRVELARDFDQEARPSPWH